MGADASKVINHCKDNPTDGRPGCRDMRPPPFGSAGMTPPKGTLPFDEAWAPYLVPGAEKDIWKTYKVVSDSTIQKIPAPLNLSGKFEIWGKYPKIYSRSPLGINQGFFNPPLHFMVDDATVLCACKDVDTRFGRGFTANGHSLAGTDYVLRAKVLSGEIAKPACWEDHSSIYNPQGDTTYDVFVNHPGFIINAVTTEGTLGIVEGAVEHPFLAGAAYLMMRRKQSGAVRRGKKRMTRKKGKTPGGIKHWRHKK